MGKKLPSYRLHKPSGLAVVTIDGKDHYLGQFGSEESRRAFGELIAKQASGFPIDPLRSAFEASGISINELTLAFMLHADKPKGITNTELAILSVLWDHQSTTVREIAELATWSRRRSSRRHATDS